MTALGAASPSRLQTFKVVGSMQVGLDDQWPRWLGLTTNRSAWAEALGSLPSSIVRLELGLDHELDDPADYARARIDWLVLSVAVVTERIGDGTWTRLKVLSMHCDWPRRALMHGYSPTLCSALRGLARSMREFEDLCASRDVKIIDREPQR